MPRLAWSCPGAPMQSGPPVFSGPKLRRRLSAVMAWLRVHWRSKTHVLLLGGSGLSF